MDAGEIFDANDNEIARLVHVKSRQAGLLMYDEAMTEANAILIARAPDLLRENAELVALLRELCEAGKITPDFGQKQAERLGRAWTAARAVVAKARA